MSKLVSVIIPCYNAEKWIEEAINSCLNQAHPEVEIIIIDDGSTDRSLEIIKRYQEITWESGPNRGGSYARNRGFALSKGRYIQFLDADDYILPEKIKKQVAFLEETEADVVYGDWRHQRHFPNGQILLEEVKVSGVQQNILESLLADWWVAPACLLFRRTVVEIAGGWDESLKAGQDRDFFLSVVMSGAKVVYQPGCYSVYRRYGNVTVSTTSKTRHLENHHLILQKTEANLSDQGKLSAKYRCALAQSYFVMARSYLKIDLEKYYSYLDKTNSLCPEFEPNRQHRTKVYNFVQGMLGFRKLEKLTFTLKTMQMFLENKFGAFKS